MLSANSKATLQRDLTQLQNRIASTLRSDSHEHEVLISVSVSDADGTVYDTVEPTGKTSNRAVGSMSDNSRFATGIALTTNRKRVAAVFEVAASVFALLGNDALVVNATFQDNDLGGTLSSPRTTDFVAQCYVKDGKLFTREVVVDDRS